MRFIFTSVIRRHVFVLLAIALAAPILNGCSTLGIATTDDITAMESRLQNSDRSTVTRVDNLERGTNDMQVTLNQITSNIDSLSAQFSRARVWLETMNLDTISADAQEATKAATSAEARSRAFLEHYLEWIKEQHATLEKQITALEAQMKQGAKVTPKSTDSTDDTSTKPPADTGGDGGGGD
jgi:uncharacterized phage infection (PIP) family protein YhgE